MKVINHNAPNLLFEKVEELAQEPHESWRCVYFKYADKPEKNNHALYANFVVNPIINMFEDSSGYIYLCDDGDIFILFQGALRPAIVRLGTHFGDIDPEHFRQPSDTTSAFDLGRQWDNFYELCEDKYLKSLVIDHEAHHMHHSFVSIRRA